MEQKCQAHVKAPWLYNRGNPAKTVETNDLVKKIAKNGTIESVVQRVDGLTSAKLEVVRDVLLKKGLRGLEEYVCLLFQVKLFFKPEQLKTIRIDDIVPDGCRSRHGIIIFLGFKVQNQGEKTFLLWAEQELASVFTCPIVHLFALLKLRNCFSGLIFGKPIVNQIVKTLKNIIYCCEVDDNCNVFPKGNLVVKKNKNKKINSSNNVKDIAEIEHIIERKFKFGVSSGKVTGVFLAHYGGATRDKLLLCTQYKDSKSVDICIQQAQSAEALERRNNYFR
jgi:hypothetical protein